MKKTICLLIAAIIIAAASVQLPAAAEGTPFSDVAEADWFYEYVSFVSERGLMIGVSGNRFGPDEKMTRGQFVTILSRLSDDDMSAYSGKSVFSDVDVGGYYAAPVAWAKANGIANGTGMGRFEPNAPVLRQEFAAFFVRYMRYSGVSLAEDFSTPLFPEAFPEWAKADIETLHRTGLVLGDTAGRFNPKNGMTRAEIAAVVTRFVKMIDAEPSPPFAL